MNFPWITNLWRHKCLPLRGTNSVRFKSQHIRRSQNSSVAELKVWNYPNNTVSFEIHLFSVQFVAISRHYLRLKCGTLSFLLLARPCSIFLLSVFVFRTFLLLLNSFLALLLLRILLDFILVLLYREGLDQMIPPRSKLCTNTTFHCRHRDVCGNSPNPVADSSAATAKNSPNSELNFP